VHDLDGGTVKMQAIQQGSLWKIETIREHPAFVAQKPAKRDQAMGGKQIAKVETNPKVAKLTLTLIDDMD
jgi:hypothetical protein